MIWDEQIEQELAKAAAGLQEGNDGLARVCARRAVALGAQNLVQRSGAKTWPADVMNQLQKIQEEEMFPVDVKEAAQLGGLKPTLELHWPHEIMYDGFS
jgi:hypothetical protein